MAILAWVVFGVLSWLVFGLMVVRMASRRGHIWGYHSKNPLLGRAAIIFQAPALILECKVMEWCVSENDQLAAGATRLLWAKFKDPRADVEVLAARIGERQSS